MASSRSKTGASSVPSKTTASSAASAVSADSTLSGMPTRALPLAAQCERLVIQRIHTGDWLPGDQLPSEAELSIQLGVSRATLRTALSSLVRRGLIVSRHGVGNFVSATSQVGHTLTEAVDLGTLLAANGAAVTVRFDHAELMPAEAEVASALGITTNDEVLRTAKCFLADGHPMIYVRNSVPVRLLGKDLAARLADSPEPTEPLFDFLQGTAKATTEYQLSSLRAVLGSAIDYPNSPVDRGVPVMEITEIGYTADNTPIWFSRNWYPPSDMQFQLVRHRPHPESR